jgi:hypothetical protein
MISILVPQDGVPLTTSVSPLLQALKKACPDVPISSVIVTSNAIYITIGDIILTYTRHCDEPSHACIQVCIGTILILNNDPETTLDYIQCVVALVENLLNLHALGKLFEALPPPTTLYVVKEGNMFRIMVNDFASDSKTATIQGGCLINCGIPLRSGSQPDLALMAQFLDIIKPAPVETFYVKLVATDKGFIGLHDHQGKKFISLSNNQGVSTKLDLKDIRLLDMERFLKKPTNDMVVIHTTGTPFSGVVGHLEFSCANFATIKVGDERYSVSTGQWAFLSNLLII